MGPAPPVFIVARAREQSTSALLRMAMQRVVREHQNDDDPARHGEVVGSSPETAASVGTG